MKAIKKYKGGGKPSVRKSVTKNIKKRDEAEIDRRYESTVGRNPRTGELNYPIGLDMDKFDATAGSSGNPDKLRKAISDEYYAEKRKEMGIDKIKTYFNGGKGPDKKRKAAKSKASAAYLAKQKKVREEKEETALRLKRKNREMRAVKAEERGDYELARRIRSQGETLKDKETQKRF